jgi:predicted nucleic acid-binding protein
MNGRTNGRFVLDSCVCINFLNKNPKLSDSIVAATAVVLEAQLITTDDKLRRLLWPGFNAAM